MIFHRYHRIDPESLGLLRAINCKLDTVLENQEKIMASLDDVLKDVTDESTQIDGLSTLITGLKQQVDRVGADGAVRVALTLPRQREPPGRFAAHDVGEDLSRARDAPPLLIAVEPVDILVPEAVCRDLMIFGSERAH